MIEECVSCTMWPSSLGWLLSALDVRVHNVVLSVLYSIKIKDHKRGNPKLQGRGNNMYIQNE